MAVAWARFVEARPALAATADAKLWEERAVEVLARNIRSDRFSAARSFLSAQPDDQQMLLNYAEQILAELLAEWDRVSALRQGDSARWGAIIGRMERLAYRWLGPSGRELWAAWEARVVASKTCADLWEWLQTNFYPFDVPFDRWSARALVNRLHEAARKQRLQARRVTESLDRPVFDQKLTYGELIQTRSLEEWLEREANREALLQALEELDARQARLIRLWYLEDWSADEIAADLGLQIGNVYVLRHRAIQKLRTILLGDVRLGLVDALHFLKEEERRVSPVAGQAGIEEATP